MGSIRLQFYATDVELLSWVDSWRFKFRLHAMAEQSEPQYRQARLDELAPDDFRIWRVWMSPNRFELDEAGSANSWYFDHPNEMSILLGKGSENALHETWMAAGGTDEEMAVWRRVVRAAKRELRRHEFTAETPKGPFEGMKLWCSDGALEFVRRGGVLRQVESSTISYRL